MRENVTQTDISSSQPSIILAIEAAVRGGSISLLEGKCEIASWHGVTEVSRAEDLLFNIAELFQHTNTDRKNVNMIAVSNGPGSYTGIRIGLATAFGLGNALGIACFGVSLLKAIALANPRLLRCIVAVPIGRAEVCWQQFENNGDSTDNVPPARTGTANHLLEEFQRLSDYHLISHQDLYEILSGIPAFVGMKGRAVDGGRNFAYPVGLAAQDANFVSDLHPNYVRNSRFISNNV